MATVTKTDGVIREKNYIQQVPTLFVKVSFESFFKIRGRAFEMSIVPKKKTVERKVGRFGSNVLVFDIDLLQVIKL